MSDLFVLSSLYEGLPNVILEAITLKKFVISSNCPTGPNEILMKGQFGMLFKTQNHIELSKKILEFNNNRNKDLALRNQYTFKCKFCGKDFGTNVIELALHIGEIHDSPRN